MGEWKTFPLVSVGQVIVPILVGQYGTPSFLLSSHSIYAEIVGFLQHSSGSNQTVLAKVIYFSDANRLDEAYALPLFERHYCDDDRYPPLLPIEYIKQVVHMKHACSYDSQTGGCRQIVDSKRGKMYKHDLESNKLFILFPPMCGI